MTTEIQHTVESTSLIPGLDTIKDFVLNLGPTGLTIVVALFVGRYLKAWPRFDNKKIPLVLPIVGSVVYSILAGPSWENIFRGFLFGGFAVCVHQWSKGTIKK